MAPAPFGVTYDYRCPFARNVHEHLVSALRDGAGWEVEFLPFSLTQSHIEEGEEPVWGRPDKASDLMAIEAGLVVRDRFPDRFFEVHLGLFAARHDHARDLRDESVVRAVLDDEGVDAHAVFSEMGDGRVRQVFRSAHEAAVADHQVFGVPTFIADGTAAFVRVMTRPEGDADLARRTIEQCLELLLLHPEINEFKHTSISH
ncbi:MAG: DsbA family protein [Acidimicrobiales bacterium]